MQAGTLWTSHPAVPRQKLFSKKSPPCAHNAAFHVYCRENPFYAVSQKAAFAMRKHRYPGQYARVGLILAAIGAAMLIALILPWWFWWLAVGLGFLCGGIWLLKR